MTVESIESAQDNARVEDGQTDLVRELHGLKEEHRDLDSAIEALERNVVADQLQIQRLKKRKLTLRDRIAYVEDQLTPDIIA
ncbi:YdcH family protein [Methylobacterium dankookense]|uniref:DUF465 domain-containing protein n=1 Tax=Methylobacterium dankookense TaxID=560405 RepID=A0A564FYM7_9HYPH|nr:DUF465 domain-containing protein [Methylobacterium dankookense]GJD54259.1 hypothetical protein IFDJLNFL_0127 [Methylobacterium dankookense]VUF12896.1 hypothetical protein MTDSW087_02591 [Methylobacterium dankookense]